MRRRLRELKIKHVARYSAAVACGVLVLTLIYIFYAAGGTEAGQRADGAGDVKNGFTQHVSKMTADLATQMCGYCVPPVLSPDLLYPVFETRELSEVQAARPGCRGAGGARESDGAMVVAKRKKSTNDVVCVRETCGAFEEQESADGALMGKRCHHFLYAKGRAPWTRDQLLHDSDYFDEFLERYTGKLSVGLAVAGLRVEHAANSTRLFVGESAGTETRLRENAGGQRLSHLFAVWSIIRKLKPSFIIESGRFRGWGLYNARMAAGKDTVIYSIDPHPQGSPVWIDDNERTHYVGGLEGTAGGAGGSGGTASGRQRLAGECRIQIDGRVVGARAYDFVDVADVDWAAMGVDAARTLVILDDHASVPRRVAELRKQGFVHYYVDDNAPRPAGDSLCPKYLADVRPALAEHAWRIPLYDDFGAPLGRVSYPALMAMGEQFFADVETYVEFPPLVLHEAFFRERARDFHTASAQEVWEMTAEPLLPFDHAVFDALTLTYEETNYYYCAYLRLFA